MLQPYRYAATQPYHHTATQPGSSSTMQPCSTTPCPVYSILLYTLYYTLHTHTHTHPHGVTRPHHTPPGGKRSDAVGEEQRRRKRLGDWEGCSAAKLGAVSSPGQRGVVKGGYSTVASHRAPLDTLATATDGIFAHLLLLRERNDYFPTLKKQHSALRYCDNERW